MKACKVYEVPEDRKGTIQTWKNLGLDTIMLGKKCLKDLTFLEELYNFGLEWSIIEPLLLVDEDSKFTDFAQDSCGNPAVNDWVRFACPNNKLWLESVYSRLYEHSLLKPNGISLDFLRFFQFWEIVPEKAKRENLIQTCFCPSCKESFRTFIKEKESRNTKEDDLGQWRCSLITSITENAARIIRSVSSSIRIGLHIVPWCTSDYGNSRENILGQDLSALAEIADYFTPMTYHHMLGRPPSYIEKVVKNIFLLTSGKIPIVPCIQVRPYYTNKKLDGKEFSISVRAALKSPSSGIAFFSSEDLLKDTEKMKIVEKELGEIK